MDKHSQQMKNSVRAELGRNQEGRTRMCHELTTKPTLMRPNRET